MVLDFGQIKVNQIPGNILSIIKESRVERVFLHRIWIKFKDFDIHKYMVPDLVYLARAQTFDGSFF
jgi:hypothetical protein